MLRWTVLTLLGLFGAAAQMRPPAVPLVAHDPYFSIWSMADHLNGDGTKHWTGKPNTLTAYARIDGKTYRIMGRERQAGNELPQTRLEVLPTRTIYEFAGAGATVGLTFFTPALPDDLDVLSRPLTYLEWTAASTDGREHAGRDLLRCGQRPGGQHAGPAGACRALSARRTSPAAHGLARAARARQARRRSAHRLGLPLPCRRQGRGRHRLRRRSCAGARRLRCFRPTAGFRRAWRRAARRPGAGLRHRARQGGREPGLALPDAGLRRSLRHRILPAQRARLVAAQRRDGRRPAAQRAPRARFAAGARASASTPN